MTQPDPDLRDRIAAALWEEAERTIVAEWICCEPVNPKHDLCVQGDATMRMVRSLIFDGDRTLADVMLAVLPAPDQRAAVLLAAADVFAAKGKVVLAASQVAAELRRLAGEAQQGERPRCPHCHLPHDLTPGSMPVAACKSILASLAQAEQLHSEGDHHLCAAVNCEVIRARRTREAQQDETPGLWIVQKICCGRDDGTPEFATWEEADQFRETYIDSARIAGHERTAIIRAKGGEARQDPAPGGELAFVTRVLELFSLSHADLYDGGLFWRVDDGKLRLYANVSDVFAWGGADAEPITPETLPALEKAFTDLKALDADLYTAELYAARQRGERPQGAAYPDDKHQAWREISALFDACGPERPLGLGNPKAAPAHVARAGQPETDEEAGDGQQSP